METKLPKRKSIRLNNFDYSTPGLYFLTLCAADKKNYFWNQGFDPNTFYWEQTEEHCVRPFNLPLTQCGEVVLSELEKWHSTYEFVKLYSYVIMPDHLHIIVAIIADEVGNRRNAPTVARMVQQFKGSVTKKLGVSIWQKSFMEHVVRDREDYEIRLNYIYNNPLKWYRDRLSD